MIAQKLKTIDGKLLISIPSQLHELTLGQLIRMQEVDSLTDLDAISILSGVSVDDLKNVNDFNDFDVFAETVLSLSNQISYLYNADVIPKKIGLKINDKEVKVDVISHLSVEPAGAFMAAREIIADEIQQHIAKHGEEGWQESFNPSLKACCQLLAQYFYCRATGSKYNDHKAEQFAETIKQMRVTEALPLARHFFMSYPNLSKPKTGFWHRLRQLWSKRQVYNRSKSLNTSTR
ncbi:MAG: hypothetical protein V4619_00360 [Bacteroidota bacterium]